MFAFHKGFIIKKLFPQIGFCQAMTMVRGAMWMDNILPGRSSASNGGGGGGGGRGSDTSAAAATSPDHHHYQPPQQHHHHHHVSPKSLPPYQPPPPPPSYHHHRFSGGPNSYNPWLVRVRRQQCESLDWERRGTFLPFPLFFFFFWWACRISGFIPHFMRTF